MLDQRHESVARLVNSLVASHREKKHVDVFASLSTINSDLMTKLIFGKRFSLDSTGEEKTISQIVRDLTAIDLFSLGECFPCLKWLDVDRVEGKLKILNAGYDSVVSKLLEERVRKLSDGEEDDDDSTDFSRTLLSMLDREDGSGLTYDQIKAAIADMYIAGTETTANVATFAMAEVLRHPDIKQKLVKELDDVVGHERLLMESDVGNLNYLKMVVKEVVRLHPPLPLLVPHQSTAPSDVAGYHIPANTQVVVNVYAIQRDPKSWEEPLAFKPDRFSIALSM